MSWPFILVKEFIIFGFREMGMHKLRVWITEHWSYSIHVSNILNESLNWWSLILFLGALLNEHAIFLKSAWHLDLYIKVHTSQDVAAETFFQRVVWLFGFSTWTNFAVSLFVFLKNIWKKKIKILFEILNTIQKFYLDKFYFVPLYYVNLKS